MSERKAIFTYERSEVGNLYYFAPQTRTTGPYREQRHVNAIVDIASDGTFAGVELIDDMPPLDLTSKGVTVDDSIPSPNDHQADLLTTPATQPAQPDLEVVAYTNNAQLRFHEGKALMWREFDIRWMVRLVRLTDAQAHIAALTAEIEELTRERDRAEKMAGDYCGSMCQSITEKGWEADRAETAEARITDLEAVIKDGLVELERSTRPSHAWQLRARAALHPTSSREGE